MGGIEMYAAGLTGASVMLAFSLGSAWWRERGHGAKPIAKESAGSGPPAIDTAIGLWDEIDLLKARVLELERRHQDNRPVSEPLVGAALRRAIANMEVKDELGLKPMEWNRTQ